MGAWCQESINEGGSSRSLLNRVKAEVAVDYRAKGRKLGGAFLFGALALAAVRRTYVRGPALEESLAEALVSLSLRVEDCAGLQCTAYVSTTESYDGASFVLAYWPEDDVSNVAYSEEVALTGDHEVRLYRLRADCEYGVVARVKPGVGASVTSPAASDFYVPKTGVDKFDLGPIGDVTGDPAFEMLLFPYLDEESSFRGLVAADADGFAVWYQNLSTTIHRSHIEGFSQFADGTRYCINDQGVGAVLVVSSQNLVEHALQRPDLLAATKRFGADARIYDWSFMGHECRATADDKIITTGYVYQEADEILDIEGTKVKWVAEEFVLLWNPENSTNVIEDGSEPYRGQDIEHMLWLSDYVSLEEVLAARNESSKDVILELNSGVDANATWGSDVDGTGIMYLHVSSASVSPDGLLYIIAMRNINTVIAIHRESRDLKWVFSSTLKRNDFKMSGSNAKFFNPHDAIMTDVHGRESLCLSDEGYFRIGCEEDTEHNDYFCYSRGVCYDLDFTEGTAAISYEFSYPLDGRNVDTAVKRHEDLFNLNGGNVVHVPGTDRMLTAFTSVYKEQFAEHSYAFETNSTGGLRASVLLPHIASWTDTGGGTSGLYRVLPIDTAGGERKTVDSEWMVEPVASSATDDADAAQPSDPIPQLNALDVVDDVAAGDEVSFLLYKRTSLSSNPKAECAWLRKAMMFDDAFTHNFTLSDPQPGDSNLCAQRCASNPEFFSLHDLQTWKAIEGEMSSDDWIASWNAAHGKLGTADWAGWDEWMSMSLSFWVETLGPFVENFDKLGITYLARTYASTDATTVYVVLLTNPYTGAIYELHSDVADAPTLTFSALEKQACPKAVELSHTVAEMTAWLDRAQRERTNMGGHPTMVVRVSHPTTDASAMAAYFDKLDLSGALDATTIESESCSVAVARFPQSLASVVPGAWARVQFVDNRAARAAPHSVASYETYVGDLHGKVMSENFGWDRFIDSHLGIKVEGAYLDKIKPYLDSNAIPYEPHKETDHYDDDSTGSVWTAGFSGMAMEFEGHFSGDEFHNVTAFKFCRPS
ncbi:hypothetical protein SO694_00004130 [Aureococcus anophagefferens]|uniref:Uncharacterized protein n=1 Tax=Aureococcus anophagefferens TaxID=44056 RepID=A0ABR1G9E7_AURAN